MLIKALCDYYDMLENKLDENEKIPEYMSKETVSHLIILSEEGELKDIVDYTYPEEIKLKNDKTKTVNKPREIRLPKRTQKPGLDVNVVEHRGLYIFGLNFKNGRLTTDFDKRDDPKKNPLFKERTIDFFKDLTSPVAVAYCKFAERWNPENETENEILLKLGKEVVSGKFCFGLDYNTMLNEDEQTLEKFKSRYDEQNKSDESTANLEMDAISGEMQPIAELHDKIKGISGASTTGSVLVSAKCDAYESFGKKMAYISNISVSSMKKYTSALNGLLSDNFHKITIDDMTILFFAVSKNDKQESSFFAAATCAKPSSQEVDSQVKNALTALKWGETVDYSAFEMDENDSFYVVGLTPNASRVSQRFLIRNRFGAIIENAVIHQRDMAVKYGGRDVSIGMITHELISPKSTRDKASPSLVSELFKAILNGTNYPTTLLETVVRRIKTDSDDPDKNRYFIKINDTRIGIIKACLNRRARLSNKEEEIKMGLDETNNNQAYVCGRLFAVLEKIQKDSYQTGNDGKVDKTKSLNKTIKDAYFATAMSKPSTVFPKLFSLAQNHLAKLKNSGNYEDLLRNVANLLDNEFSSTLSLEDQGRFIIGYYHQNNELYKKKENTQTK